MSHTLTASKLINWINANTGSNLVSAATPSSDSLALIQQCLDAAIAQVEAYCNLPETYPVDVELAILKHAASLWESRKTPNGLAMLEDFGAVRVPSAFSTDVRQMLEYYRAWRFSQ